MKILINNQEVVCDKDFVINEQMLNTPSVILNNVYPKTWETSQDYISNFYHPNDYSKCLIYDDSIDPEDPTLIFCGVVKNSGNISLNPREPHYLSLQILDFKQFLSECETLDFVIYQKTIIEAINEVINAVSDYGFVLGNVDILNPNDIIGAYSTKDKSAYEVFCYLADITQSRWTTRLVDENTVAVDFYDPTLLPSGTAISYTQTWFENNLIDDMTYSYGTYNYRNKQIMTSNQVYGNISQQQLITYDGYTQQLFTEQVIGKINTITVDNVEKTVATTSEQELGVTADFYYTTGNNFFEKNMSISIGQQILINYIPIVEGRQIITNSSEISRVTTGTGRKGVVARYENRNDATTSTELQLIGQSYIKYKGTPEIKLKVKSRSNIWNVGEKVSFTSPIAELTTDYMVKIKKIEYITSVDTIFYTFELTSSFNSETEINYFDNQRSKAKGNIAEGQYISKNIDINSNANVIFYDTQITKVDIIGNNILECTLNAPLTN